MLHNSNVAQCAVFGFKPPKIRSFTFFFYGLKTRIKPVPGPGDYRIKIVHKASGLI